MLEQESKCSRESSCLEPSVPLFCQRWGADGAGFVVGVKKSGKAPARFRLTGANIYEAGQIVLDVFQLASLCFLVAGASVGEASSGSGSDAQDEDDKYEIQGRVGHVFVAITNAGRFLTLSFEESAAGATEFMNDVSSFLTVQVLFFVAVGFVGLWYLVVVSPFVVHYYLEDWSIWRGRTPNAKLNSDPMWLKIVNFLSRECFLTICLKVLTSVLSVTQYPVDPCER